MCINRTAKVFSLFFVCFFVSQIYAAGECTLKNESDQTIYGGIYYVGKFGKGKLATSIVEVAPGMSMSIALPAYKLNRRRKIFVSEDQSKLADEIKGSDFKKGTKHKLEMLNIKKLTYKNGRLHLGA